MRGAWLILCGALVLGGAGGARAESGSFFKNLFGGGGGGSDKGGGPALVAPRAFDPDDVYCPPVLVANGGAVIQSFAGAAGDNTRLRHQIGFARYSRECKARPDGSVGVRVGVELRALLGPAGAPGRFDAPVTIAIKYNEQTVTARSHRLVVPVPAGSAQGEASVIENDLVVPADRAVGYDIVVALGAPPARAKPVAKRRKPAAEAANAAETEAPVPGQ